MAAEHQSVARRLLLKALSDNRELRRSEGQFLGGISFDANPLTEKQADWLDKLVARYGEGEMA